MSPPELKAAVPHRRLRRILVIAAALIVVVVIGDGVLGMIFRSRVASCVESAMGADFGAGIAWYIPPCGVSLHHVRISKGQPDGGREEWLTASRVVLKLAEFPKEGKPLVISLLRIDSPSMTIVSRPPPPATPVKPTSVASNDPRQSPPTPPQKIELRHLQVTNGQIAMESPGEDALVIDRINLDFSPTARTTHVYHFTAGSAANASNSVNGAGSINLDDKTLTLSELSLKANVNAILSQAHLSGKVRERLEMAHVDGTLNINGSASIPFEDWRHSSFVADVQLAAGKGSIPGSSLEIDAAHGDLHLQCDGGISPVKLTLGAFSATSGASQLNIDGGKFSTLEDGRRWEIAGVLGRLDLAAGLPPLEATHLTGRFMFTGSASGPAEFPRDASILSAVRHELILYPRDVSIQPPRYPIPIEHIDGGPITFRAGVIRFENLSGVYGTDKVLLDEAHITLEDPLQKIELADFHRVIKVDGIAGTLICKQPGPQYPASLGTVIAQLRPTGSFAIGGGSWFAINRRLPDEDARPKPDYFFRVSTAGGAFALTDHKFPLTDIHADATVSAMLVDIVNLRGRMLDGTVIANTKITPVRPVVYKGTATFYNVNLQTASRDLGLTLKKPLIGLMYLKVNASGQGVGAVRPPLQTFAADGEFQVANGNFGDIQTIRSAASNVTKADQVLDGQAAGLFSIRDEQVTLQNCAVGNPTFGLEGSGKVGFDKSLDLHAVAAPLGDWREGLKRSNVPVLEDVGSDIAGAIQQLFAAQRTLLWDIHIVGTTTAPKIKQTAAPVVTQSVAKVFGQLIRGDKEHQLIEQLREKRR